MRGFSSKFHAQIGFVNDDVSEIYDCKSRGSI